LSNGNSYCSLSPNSSCFAFVLCELERRNLANLSKVCNSFVAVRKVPLSHSFRLQGLN
jgi:hypothetical protein